MPIININGNMVKCEESVGPDGLPAVFMSDSRVTVLTPYIFKVVGMAGSSDVVFHSMGDGTGDGTVAVFVSGSNESDATLYGAISKVCSEALMLYMKSLHPSMPVKIQPVDKDEVVSQRGPKQKPVKRRPSRLYSVR